MVATGEKKGKVILAYSGGLGELLPTLARPTAYMYLFLQTLLAFFSGLSSKAMRLLPIWLMLVRRRTLRLLVPRLCSVVPLVSTLPT